MYPTIINDSLEFNMLYAFKLVYLYFICDMEEFVNKIDINDPSTFNDYLQVQFLLKLIDDWVIEVDTEAEDGESIKIQVYTDWITPVF